MAKPKRADDARRPLHDEARPLCRAHELDDTTPESSGLPGRERDRFGATVARQTQAEAVGITNAVRIPAALDRHVADHVWRVSVRDLPRLDEGKLHADAILGSIGRDVAQKGCISELRRLHVDGVPIDPERPIDTAGALDPGVASIEE